MEGEANDRMQTASRKFPELSDKTPDNLTSWYFKFRLIKTKEIDENWRLTQATAGCQGSGDQGEIKGGG